ncbi:hypothetical protein DPSP01_005995 [Paraphaeosphaeria sporulosa]
MSVTRSAFVLSFALLTHGQYGPGGQYGPDGSNEDYSSAFNGGGSSSSNNGGFISGNGILGGNTALIAHGVLASFAFVILFPTGSILIRLASFKGVWLVHGLFQIFAYLVYIAAFALGVWMTQQAPAQANLIGRYHPIIGIVLFVVLFIQPVLGLIHHFRYKKVGRRTFWSYGHLWLGRLLIPLGMINGGLGLLLATETGYGRPTTGQIIPYGVVAGITSLLWLTAAIVGERRRTKAQEVPVGVYKEQYA